MSATRAVTEHARQLSNGLFCLAVFLTKRSLEHLAWLFCLPFLSALFQSMPTYKLGSGPVAILAQVFVCAQGTLCPVSRKDTRHWHKGHPFLACCSVLLHFGAICGSIWTCTFEERTFWPTILNIYFVASGDVAASEILKLRRRDIGKKAKNKGHWKSGRAIQEIPTSILSDLFKRSQPKYTVPARWLCPVCSVHN